MDAKDQIDELNAAKAEYATAESALARARARLSRAEREAHARFMTMLADIEARVNATERRCR